MLTGRLPSSHGVVANGFYWRDRRHFEMWTAPNEVIQAPQIWDLLHRQSPPKTSAVWFPMLGKGCGADFVCMPAPIHNPDGSESLWCYTKPTGLYGELRDRFGHFPLQHFWGPMANIQSTAWIVDSAIHAAGRFRPDFFFLYLPHLDYAAQRTGPDSPAACQATRELDQVLERLIAGMRQAYAGDELLWIVASEYVITPVDHVTYPNRLLRDAGLLAVRREADGEHLDLARSQAWALVDHQFSHVFVSEGRPDVVRQVTDLFGGRAEIQYVLAGADRAAWQLDHPRSGDVVLVSSSRSWQAYYWWLDDALAPAYARTVDIHRKPGYDPVELHIDPSTRSIPLDATLVKGSHGAPATSPGQQGLLGTSWPGALPRPGLRDVDVTDLVLDHLSGVG
jgi:predicted AlkP superfamily pyrophosphatase or phosphodiesterase